MDTESGTGRLAIAATLLACGWMPSGVTTWPKYSILSETNMLLPG